MLKKLINIAFGICFILLIFNTDIFLNVNIYYKNAYDLFFLSFIVFNIFYIKPIYSAFKYEILIKEKESIPLINILKTFSVLYYSLPFIFASIGIYSYLLNKEVGWVVVISTSLYLIFILKKIFKF